jgi:TPR repeat protein
VQLDTAKPAVPATLTQTGDGKSELADAGNVAATIAPANAPPETALIKVDEASAIPTAIPQAAELITKADGLLNSGDIASARQFYLRANEMGDAKGAFGVGRTYDPVVFTALNVQGLKPDPTKAAEWYKKAVAGGVTAAKTALEGLQVAQP